ncbi:MAG: nucleoside hydrolase [Pirellulales bacterium]
MSKQLNVGRRVAALVVLLVVPLGQSPPSAAKEPVPIIFDTDMGNDVDDALALAMLHALQSRGECRLLAVTVSKDNRLAAAFVDATNRFYGRGEIPVGLVRDGATKDAGKFLQLAEERDGRELRFPHRFSDGSLPPPAVDVLRKTLAGQADDSVSIVQVGFSTNLARLLDSAPDDISPLPGRELVKQKVRLLSVMGGWFSPDRLTQEPPGAEYNIVEDVAAAQRLARDWPTPIVWSGFEVGRAIEYPAESIDNDFAYVAHHPIAEAYRLYNPPPHNRPAWDLTSALYALRPARGYFDVSPPGRVTISDDGRTTFVAASDGRHRLLTVTADQVTRAREAFVNFCSEPPPSDRND